jgi:hypothetical protein
VHALRQRSEAEHGEISPKIFHFDPRRAAARWRGFLLGSGSSPGAETNGPPQAYRTVSCSKSRSLRRNWSQRSLSFSTEVGLRPRCPLLACSLRTKCLTNGPHLSAWSRVWVLPLAHLRFSRGSAADFQIVRVKTAVLRRGSPGRLFGRRENEGATPGSFGEPGFPKALDHQLRV